MLRLTPFCLIALIIPSSTASPAGPPRPEAPPPARVGQIFIVGNNRTKQNVILEQVELYPGQILTLPDLARSERNLARLGIFQNSKGVRPSVTVLDNPTDPSYKDILVKVAEADSSSLMFGLGLNLKRIFSASLVFEERNFDLFRLPLAYEDLQSGEAFRGAGQHLRVVVSFSPADGLTVSPTLACTCLPWRKFIINFDRQSLPLPSGLIGLLIRGPFEPAPEVSFQGLLFGLPLPSERLGK